ncbi:MAG: LL-diaminopimelate aminotransferase [Clostridia bacterium]|nr:LL-diaminopimelate aminotransferase [Clostridia bacterium]
MKINKNFLALKNNYLFSEINRRASAYKLEHPNVDVISLGIGDVTQPLAPVVISAMQKAVQDLSNVQTFKGYSPNQGYMFLRENISKYDYVLKGIDISPNEICVGDGIKSDISNMLELFADKSVIALMNPVYPAYLDSVIMSGKAGKNCSGKWSKIINLYCTAENNFLPEIPIKKPDIIYLCFPNNPTGAVCDVKKLKEWIDYANKVGAIIFFDSAYEAYITEDYPHSIYEISGAKQCAIEFKSYSKTAGFTGVRCSYTVIPNDIIVGNKLVLDLWTRRQSSKFNGASYISQCGANAIYSEENRSQIKENIDYYMKNAHYIFTNLVNSGIKAYGGVNAPYIWVKTPENISSWDIFDIMLKRAGVICTPGAGFGSFGQNYIRLTAFNTYENTVKAMQNIIISKIFV